jgi:hypothetical protein
MSPQNDRRTFISYSRINKEFALELALELRSSGFDIWLDQLDIPTGSRWDDEVEQALDSCEIFMVILTPASSTSDNVKDEIGYAIDSGKRILPILLENAKVPLRLRRFQYVDFTKKSYEEGVESAKQLLRRLIDEPTIPRDESLIAKQVQLAKAERKAKRDSESSASLEVEDERLATQEVVAQPPEPSSHPVPQGIESITASSKKKSGLPLMIGVFGIGAIVVIGFVVVVIMNIFREKIPVTAPPVDNLAVEKTVASPAPQIIEVVVTSTPAPTSIQKAAQSTNTLEPTSPPATPTAGLQKYHTEEFDGDLSSWPSFVVDDRRDQPVITTEQFNDVTASIKNGSYLFDIERRKTYIYSIYNAFDYNDVRLDVHLDSRNINPSLSRLICRYSPAGGWYEFSIANNGLYNIYYAKPNASGLINYRPLANGGTDKVNAGNATNDYAISCKGNELSLYINGELIKTTSDDLSVLRTGKIGVAVSSDNSLPVLVAFSQVKISEP